MPSLDMSGPYDLSHEAINRYIEEDKIGNYAIGYINDRGKFVPRYIGRSDTDLNERLKDHVDNKNDKYNKFKYKTCSTEREAYEKECINYHHFEKSLKNKIHPDKPSNIDVRCPKCKS